MADMGELIEAIEKLEGVSEEGRKTLSDLASNVVDSFNAEIAAMDKRNEQRMDDALLVTFMAAAVSGLCHGKDNPDPEMVAGTSMAIAYQCLMKYDAIKKSTEEAPKPSAEAPKVPA